MTIKQHKYQTSDKSQNSYKINFKISILGAKIGLFKIKNRPVNKNQKVRARVTTTFSEVPNSGLTIDQKLFGVARLKLALFKFWCHFFSFIYTPFFDCGPVFRCDTRAIEKTY